MASKTIDDVIVESFKLINGYANRGTPISITDPNYLDTKYGMYDSMNNACQDLAKIIKISAVKSVTQYPDENQLTPEGFKIVRHLPGITKTYSAKGSQIFCIEIDRPCTLLFEQSTNNSTWTTLNGFYDVSGVNTAFSGNIAVTGNTSFTQRKGKLTLDSLTNYVRMSVISNYPLCSKNRFLSTNTYLTSADIPSYKPFIDYDIPSDYIALNKIMRAYDDRQLTELTDFIGPLNNKISINWYLDGQFDIHYWKRHTVITSNTVGTTELELREDIQGYVAYYVGGNAIMKRDASIGTQLLNQYYAFKESLIETDEVGITTLQAKWGV